MNLDINIEVEINDLKDWFWHRTWWSGPVSRVREAWRVLQCQHNFRFRHAQSIYGKKSAFYRCENCGITR